MTENAKLYVTLSLVKHGVEISSQQDKQQRHLLNFLTVWRGQKGNSKPKNLLPAGQLIEVKFTAFAVGVEGEACSSNYLELRDGEVNPRLRRIVPRSASTLKLTRRRQSLLIYEE